MDWFFVYLSVILGGAMIFAFHEFWVEVRVIRNPVSSSEVAIPNPPQPVYDMYGHMWAPIPELAAKLPRPPANYSWEITAVMNSYDSPALRLSLLDLRLGEVGDFIERDLVTIRRWKYAQDDTFAAFYRRAMELTPQPRDEKGKKFVAEANCRKVFYAHLLAPMIDWAQKVAASKAVTEPAALTTNYLLVETVS